jgi:hypothetical protein
MTYITAILIKFGILKDYITRHYKQLHGPLTASLNETRERVRETGA